MIVLLSIGMLPVQQAFDSPIVILQWFLPLAVTIAVDGLDRHRKAARRQRPRAELPDRSLRRIRRSGNPIPGSFDIGVTWVLTLPDTSAMP